MATVTIAVNIGAGDNVTPNANLTYKIYNGSNNLLKTVGSASSDSNVSLSGTTATIQNVDIGTNTSIKVTTIDAAGNESAKSGSFTYGGTGGTGILFSDTFTGTTIDETTKWTVISPQTDLTITQNDKLIFNQTVESAAGGLYGSKILSKPNFDLSGDLYVKFDLQRTATAEEGGILFGIGDGTHSNSIAINRGTKGSAADMQCVVTQGGTTISNTIYTIPYSNSYKLKKLENGNASFYYWNSGAWTAIVEDIATTFTSGTFKVQGTIQGASNSIANAFSFNVDNLYVTDTDFTTLTP